MWSTKSIMSSLILSLLLSLFLMAQPSLGKEYPAKPIEILCPYSAAGPMDITSRVIAEIAPKYLGESMVVINRPGAGGSIAAAEIISSKPDGYKIAYLSNIFFASTVKIQKIPFDPGHLVPIANMVEARGGLAVKSDSPYRNLNDLLNYARKSPGNLKWAHTGRGTTMHLNALLLFRKAGVQTTEIPFKGVPEVITALLGGHVDAMSFTYGSASEQLKAGNVRFLVFYGNRRDREMRDVPCTTELGFPEIGNMATLFGFYAHKDTPVKIRETLTDAFKRMSEDPAVRKVIERVGDEPRFGGPEFVREGIRRAEETSVPLLKELGLYVEK
jgi:tripartite-type tricarboxylate transporter receptor subunit TctC